LTLTIAFKNYEMNGVNQFKF